MPDTTITVRYNGPYKVSMPVKVHSHDGQEIVVDAGDESIFLCRCGQSSEKPFCDGTHKTCGFTPDGPPLT